MNNYEKYTQYLNEFSLSKIKTDIISLIDFNIDGVSTTIINRNREKFAERFYDYWYFHQINADSFDEFVFRCKRVISEFNYKYSYNINKIDINSIDIDKMGTLTDKFTENTTENKDITNDYNENEVNVRLITEKEEFLDTPQTPLQEDLYATNITNNTNNSNDSVEKQTSSTRNDSISKVKETNDEKQVATLNEIIKYMEEAFRDFDMEFIKKFDNCFLKVF